MWSLWRLLRTRRRTPDCSRAFLDRYGNNALATTVAVPVMTGAAPIHALATEVHLRPLLVELGASVPCRSLFVTEGDFENLEAVAGDWTCRQFLLSIARSEEGWVSAEVIEIRQDDDEVYVTSTALGVEHIGDISSW
jgi:hypothetical protein